MCDLKFASVCKALSISCVRFFSPSKIMAIMENHCSKLFLEKWRGQYEKVKNIFWNKCWYWNSLCWIEHIILQITALEKFCLVHLCPYTAFFVILCPLSLYFIYSIYLSDIILFACLFSILIFVSQLECQLCENRDFVFITVVE